MLIDTHCHLDFPEFDPDRGQVIRRAHDAGIGYMINIGSSLRSSLASIELAKQYAFIYAAVGIHPHEADRVDKKQQEEIRVLARQDKVVAIGEIGLDYFKNYSKQENQRALFISLMHLAKDLNLPLVVHSRQASLDTLRILKEAMPVRAVVHCFSGDTEFLKACLDSGFLVSFTCNVTYKRAQNLREIVKLTPLDKLLLETDCPYLAPEGFRGKRNEPAYVKILAQEISGIKGISVEELARVTTANAKTFFNLK